MQKARVYNGQFGFHGGNIDFSLLPSWARPYDNNGITKYHAIEKYLRERQKKDRTKKKMVNMEKRAVVLQPFGIGDCIWSQTIAHRFKKAGYHILWPVLPQFVEGLKRAYPAFEWVDVNTVDKVDLNAKVQKVINGILHIPIRWSVDIMQVPYNKCMPSKYEMYGWDWSIWKEHAMWERDKEKENALDGASGVKRRR